MAGINEYRRAGAGAYHGLFDQGDCPQVQQQHQHYGGGLIYFFRDLLLVDCFMNGGIIMIDNRRRIHWTC